MYISFEGIDGSGKSSVLDEIAKKYPDCIVTKEPQGIFRDMVLDPDNKYNLDEVARMFLYQADRSIHTMQVVKPNYDKLILCSRGILSTLCYQNMTTGIDIDTLFNISKLAAHGYLPNLILNFDVTFEKAKERMAGRDKGATDYFDRKGKDFFDGLIHKYYVFGQELSQKYGIPVITINTNHRTLEQVVSKTEFVLSNFPNFLENQCPT